jgi:hypothetical protein
MRSIYEDYCRRVTAGLIARVGVGGCRLALPVGGPEGGAVVGGRVRSGGFGDRGVVLNTATMAVVQCHVSVIYTLRRRLLRASRAAT